jgi:hypothetical protein
MTPCWWRDWLHVAHCQLAHQGGAEKSKENRKWVAFGVEGQAIVNGRRQESSKFGAEKTN